MLDNVWYFVRRRLENLLLTLTLFLIYFNIGVILFFVYNDF